MQEYQTKIDKARLKEKQVSQKESDLKVKVKADESNQKEVKTDVSTLKKDEITQKNDITKLNKGEQNLKTQLAADEKNIQADADRQVKLTKSLDITNQNIA